MSNWQQMMPTMAAYRLGKALYTLHHRAGDLDHYHRDPDGYLAQYPMTASERAMITGNDVAGLYSAGVNPYILRAHCIGMRIPEAVSVGALRSLLPVASHG